MVFVTCGTLHLIHRGAPSEAKPVLKRGEMRCVQVDGNMAVVHWPDKPTVSVLLRVHGHSPGQVEQRYQHATGGHEVVEKPEAVVKYKFIGGVEQLLSCCVVSHCTMKWWR